MRDHFEGTDLDLSTGIGAGPYKLPYRFRPLTWKIDSVEYFNERATSTQQTAFSFVTQSRAHLPDEIGGLIWFGVDDTYSTVYVPMYASMTTVPESFAASSGDFDHFSWESAFWVFNFVTNYAYSRYCDMIQDIQKLQKEIEGFYFAHQPKVEETALSLYQQSPQIAAAYLNDYSIAQSEKLIKRWKELGEFLIYKYLDGNMKDENGKVTHPGYPKEWYRRIIKENGEHFKVKEKKETSN